MPFNRKSIGSIRNQLGVSQNGFAREIGCTPQTIFNWEHGRSTPGYTALDQIHELCTSHGIADIPPFWVPPKKKQSESF